MIFEVVFAYDTHSISTCGVVGLEEIRFDANVLFTASNVNNRTKNVSFEILPFLYARRIAYRVNRDCVKNISSHTILKRFKKNYQIFEKVNCK